MILNRDPSGAPSHKCRHLVYIALLLRQWWVRGTTHNDLDLTSHDIVVVREKFSERLDGELQAPAEARSHQS